MPMLHGLGRRSAMPPSLVGFSGKLEELEGFEHLENRTFTNITWIQRDPLSGVWSLESCYEQVLKQAHCRKDHIALDRYHKRCGCSVAMPARRTNGKGSGPKGIMDVYIVKGSDSWCKNMSPLFEAPASKLSMSNMLTNLLRAFQLDDLAVFLGEHDASSSLAMDHPGPDATNEFRIINVVTRVANFFIGLHAWFHRAEPVAGAAFKPYSGIAQLNRKVKDSDLVDVLTCVWKSFVDHWAPRQNWKRWHDRAKGKGGLDVRLSKWTRFLRNLPKSRTNKHTASPFHTQRDMAAVATRILGIPSGEFFLGRSPRQVIERKQTQARADVTMMKLVTNMRLAKHFAYPLEEQTRLLRRQAQMDAFADTFVDIDRLRTISVRLDDAKEGFVVAARKGNISFVWVDVRLA
eukprot:TRINITY_DN27863_c0_g1_i1.p1 TRINITY_DN27863_c0_g1~~TRINITY_DN27863_c0_g1_i1.p1  ORF type:complete len:467 (+),score=34.18 TRINITY_DN27863_c0_g1_i1:189-1403(+)